MDLWACCVWTSVRVCRPLADMDHHHHPFPSPMDFHAVCRSVVHPEDEPTIRPSDCFWTGGIARGIPRFEPVKGMPCGTPAVLLALLLGRRFVLFGFCCPGAALTHALTHSSTPYKGGGGVTHPITQSLTRPPHWLAHSPMHPPTQSLNPLSHQLSHSRTCPRTHSLTHSIADPGE